MARTRRHFSSHVVTAFHGLPVPEKKRSRVQVLQVVQVVNFRPRAMAYRARPH